VGVGLHRNIGLRIGGYRLVRRPVFGSTVAYWKGFRRLRHGSSL
jgi:hypothetical protein